MHIKIKLGFSEIILFEGEYGSIKDAVVDAVSKGANLRGAYLGGAYLGGAYLEGAYLEDKKLVGERPILCIGPIGSRSAYLAAYLTDKGTMIKAGCFLGTLDEFHEKVSITHNNNKHAKEYEVAIAMIRVHAELWGKK